MSAVAYLPNSASVDAAWERYRALAVALADDPALAGNRTHMESLARAERDWKAAFNAMEAKG